MSYFNLLIAEEYEDKTTGEVKTMWYRAGKAFPHKSGDGFNLQIPEGISLSGKVLMMPKDKQEPVAGDE